METIGIIYEITGNPYFNLEIDGYSNICEYVYPTEINNICKALKSHGYDYEIIDGAFDLLQREQYLKSKCFVFFNKSIGFKGLERKTPVPVLGQLYQLPMIGSTAYAMTLSRHKFHTNKLLKGMGFLVPEAWLIYSSDENLKITKYPVIVKPNAESDSLGIDERSICHTIGEVKDKVSEIINFFGAPVIVEEYISGDEIKVAVIGNDDDIAAVEAVKVLKKGKSIAGSFQTRNDVISDCLTCSPISENYIIMTVNVLARRIHKAMELNDYSRIDFRVGENNRVYCMEISTHPYIAEKDASFTSAALMHYENYPAIIEAILLAARKRLKV